MDYNEMVFTPENMEAGLHTELINYLINYHLNDDERFNDIHITTDGECLIVQWQLVPYDRSYGGGFEFVDDDCLIVREHLLPDRTYTYAPANESYDDVLRNWLDEHPGWEKNQFGLWTYNGDTVTDVTDSEE